MGISKKLREEVRVKFGGKCAYSGTDLKDDWQIDHVIPKTMWVVSKLNGSPNDINNLVPCQSIINHYKGSLPLETFRAWFLGELHLRFKKLPKNPKTEKSVKKKQYLLEVASLFDITEHKPFKGIFYFEII